MRRRGEGKEGQGKDSRWKKGRVREVNEEKGREWQKGQGKDGLGMQMKGREG